MLSTLLATKLHRPRPTSSLVARPRLTQRLDEGLRNGHHLILVVAPAGYGKTTLVSHWLSYAGIPSAWLLLDEGDNDPVRFFAYVASALQALNLKVDRSLLETFHLSPQSPQALVCPLINDLSATDRPIILALDDYHLITDVLIQDAMAFLLDHAPSNLHLVVLTRVDPPFPLPRLRVRELITEVRDRDLRFTPEEMAVFLNSVHRLNLPAEQVAALESRTEGWPAGVQLAALSLQGWSTERAAQFVRAFSGSHHYIVDYLFDEVLRRQPAQVREFLLQTSILDRMCAPLCDAILCREPPESGEQRRDEGISPAPPPPCAPAQDLLEHLERSNVFVVPLDDERRWYRYHHLFIDVLRQMAKSSSRPDQIAERHGRASDWYRQNGFAADAYHHALLAGHHQQAAEIVEENAWTMVLHGQLATLERWIRALPGYAVAARPWLRIYHAWALLFRETEAAAANLKAIEEQSQVGGWTALSAEMQGHITAIRAWIAYLNRDLDRAVVLSRRALELCPQIDAAVSGGLVAILGDGCLMHSDFPGGARAYAEAVDLAQSSGNIMLEVAARTSLGDVKEMMGRLHDAETIFQEALQIAILHSSPAAAQAYLCLAGVHREWNDLESARLFAEKAIESCRVWGVVDTLACGYVSLAATLQAQNRVPDANLALAEVSQIIREHSPELRSMPWIGAIRARLWLAQGKLADARRWAETRGLREEGKLDFRNEIEHLTLVRILLAEHRADSAMRLLSRLQGAVESTGRQGNPEVLVLRAIALAIQADTTPALAVLDQALSLAQHEGYMRVFLDEGKSMATLLKTAITKCGNDALLAYARKLLAAFNDEVQPVPAVQPPHTGILSERELEVLRLMAAGRSNREIAGELVIAIGTAKRHTANIFDRLDARNRTDAVAKGRELGLL